MLFYFFKVLEVNIFENLVLSVHITRVKSVVGKKYLIKATTNRSKNDRNGRSSVG